jgi:hypothetical protein
MAPEGPPNKNSFSDIHERYVMSDDFWNAGERRMFHAIAFYASSLAVDDREAPAVDGRLTVMAQFDRPSLSARCGSTDPPVELVDDGNGRRYYGSIPT